MGTYPLAKGRASLAVPCVAHRRALPRPCAERSAQARGEEKHLNLDPPLWATHGAGTTTRQTIDTEPRYEMKSREAKTSVSEVPLMLLAALFLAFFIALFVAIGGDDEADMRAHAKWMAETKGDGAWVMW